jgi:hypothetical protein
VLDVSLLLGLLFYAEGGGSEVCKVLRRDIRVFIHVFNTLDRKSNVQVKLTLKQAMEARGVVRRRGSDNL